MVSYRTAFAATNIRTNQQTCYERQFEFNPTKSVELDLRRRKDWLSVRKEALVSVSYKTARRERAWPNRPFGFGRSGARPREGLGSFGLPG